MARLTLPPVIESYLLAKSGSGSIDADAWFTPDAVVYDNGEDLVKNGIDEIRDWLGHTGGYDLTVEPTSAENVEGELHVYATVSGNFPGSPFAFLYKFTLEGGKIRKLDIDPIGPLNP